MHSSARLSSGAMLLVALLGCHRGLPATTPWAASPVDLQVLDELNRVRRNPCAYADEIARLLPLFDGAILELPGRIPVLTKEGAAPVEEAVRELRALAPLRALALDEGLCRAARDHARDLGNTGRRSHTGSDGSDLGVRVRRHGSLQGHAGEAIAFGHSDAKTIIRSLIIDDGVADRGHRRTVLDPRYRQAGIATFWHREDSFVCVIDLADSFTRRR